MRGNGSTAVAVGLLSLCAATACSSQVPGETISVSRENRTIAVTVTDSITVLADSATIHIGYILYAADSQTAYTTASKTSTAIMAALKDAGVAKAAIESESQAVGAVQDYGNNSWTPQERAERKFLVTQSWTVHSSAADAAKILDLAVKAGANQSGQIDWGLADAETPAAQAAAKALRHARAIAQAMADGLNAKLGSLVFASNQAPAAQIFQNGFGGRGIALDQAAALPLSLAPKRVEKSATVYAVFSIE
jgi:uncharacterized protein